MISINKQLRKSYTDALAGLMVNATPIPAYYSALPSDINPQNYIVFGQMNNNDAGTKSSSDTSTTMTVEIQTYTDGTNNDGDLADDIANEVLTRIYPTPSSTLTLSNGQIVTTELANDITQPPVSQANRTYIQRILTFRHIIFQN